MAEARGILLDDSTKRQSPRRSSCTAIGRDKFQHLTMDALQCKALDKHRHKDKGEMFHSWLKGGGALVGAAYKIAPSKLRARLCESLGGGGGYWRHLQHASALAATLSLSVSCPALSHLLSSSLVVVATAAAALVCLAFNVKHLHDTGLWLPKSELTLFLAAAACYCHGKHQSQLKKEIN